MIPSNFTAAQNEIMTQLVDAYYDSHNPTWVTLTAEGAREIRPLVVLGFAARQTLRGRRTRHEVTDLGLQIWGALDTAMATPDGVNPASGEPWPVASPDSLATYAIWNYGDMVEVVVEAESVLDALDRTFDDRRWFVYDHDCEDRGGTATAIIQGHGKVYVSEITSTMNWWK